MEEQIKSDAWIADLKRVIPESIYSKFGEDSYLGFILNNIGITNKYFLDMYAGDGVKYSNTRVLSENYKWKGLCIDSVHSNKIVKKHTVTKDNVIELLTSYKVPASFDLLSFNLEGNDYWVLKELLASYSPRVIIMSYNCCAAKDKTTAIKYDPSHIYRKDGGFGFSFLAGKKLAAEFGYKVIFQNANQNMYLLRNDCFISPEVEIDVPFNQVITWPAKPAYEWVNV